MRIAFASSFVRKALTMRSLGLGLHGSKRKHGQLPRPPTVILSDQLGLCASLEYARLGAAFAKAQTSRRTPKRGGHSKTASSSRWMIPGFRRMTFGNHGLLLNSR